MKIREALCLLALLPAGLQAQRAGTIEVGAFGHYTKLDKDILLGDNSIGVGGRLGFFAMRYIALEAEYSYGTIGDNIRGVSAWLPFRGFVTGNATIGSRARLILGLGYKHDTWKGDTTKNEFEDGFTALAGLRLCFGDKWSFRPEVVFDQNPSPNFQTPVTSQSKHFQIRAGISRFFGRGSGTCAASDAAPPPAPMPVTPPPSQPPPPPPVPAPTVTLTASPTSIVGGGNAILVWNASNATRCTASWTTSTATAGNQTVTPTSTTEYTITCTGPGGSVTGATTVSVAMPTVAPPGQAQPREMFRLEGVFFDFDKSTIKPEGRVKLDSAVTILNRYSDMRVEIQGHTDSVGTEAYNIGLSNRRANAVREYLVSRGIAASRLSNRGFGETQPATSNDTAEGRAMNRRVMLIELR
jgi:outer membrane protein OmpA-like peptidoglycan-associated protein